MIDSGPVGMCVSPWKAIRRQLAPARGSLSCLRAACQVSVRQVCAACKDVGKRSQFGILRAGNRDRYQHFGLGFGLNGILLRGNQSTIELLYDVYTDVLTAIDP